jgi:hypothetical protein
MNGKSYIGDSIVVRNNKVIIDGVDVTPDSKVITITVEGNIEELHVDCCNSLIVNGNVGLLNTQSGDVECKDVIGNLNLTNGDVECGNVGGSIQTVSGDIKCWNVNGNVYTSSGDIKYRK